MKLALAIASLVVFAVHGVVFYDQFFNKWSATRPHTLIKPADRPATKPRRPTWPPAAHVLNKSW